jgi:glycosyltransferase involved in cell wall biosynthesis
MSEPSVSVALCTYNGARYLEQQLASISSQTLPPDEVVVCDDGSQDGTLDLLRRFSRTVDFPVRVFENDGVRLGSTKNFEKAIGLCQREIVCLADQDDVWKPRKLAVLHATLEEYPDAGYVFSDAELIDDIDSPIRTSLWESVHFRGAVLGNFSKSMQVEALLHRSAVTGATMAFRRGLNSIILPISSYVVHDYWISLLASCVGSYGVPIPESLIQYRQHTGQQIGVRRRSLLEKVRWARQVGPAEYSSRTQGLQDVRDRLLFATREGWTCPANHVSLVEEKMEHCSRRAVAHSSHGTTRIRTVFSEALNGRYARFSNSWQSVMEDLCF